jgi:hypothetical protein
LGIKVGKKVWNYEGLKVKSQISVNGSGFDCSNVLLFYASPCPLPAIIKVPDLSDRSGTLIKIMI